jgi:hypothetical protein
MALKANAMRNCGKLEAEAECRSKAYEAKGDNYNAKQTQKQAEHLYQNFHGHLHAIEHACKAHMPSGSGFDKGTQFNFDKSTDDKLIFITAFHHMNSNGYYCGWTDHTVIVTPCFGEINIKVTGKNYRDIKEYIADTFLTCLTNIVDADGELVL